jgi:hypothetical protein
MAAGFLSAWFKGRHQAILAMAFTGNHTLDHSWPRNGP